MRRHSLAKSSNRHSRYSFARKASPKSPLESTSASKSPGVGTCGSRPCKSPFHRIFGTGKRGAAERGRSAPATASKIRSKFVVISRCLPFLLRDKLRSGPPVIRPSSNSIAVSSDFRRPSARSLWFNRCRKLERCAYSSDQTGAFSHCAAGALFLAEFISWSWSIATWRGGSALRKTIGGSLPVKFFRWR